jgi:hypothetical protein
MDIKAAFDTIDQNKMLEVIEDLLDKVRVSCARQHRGLSGVVVYREICLGCL